MKAKSIALTPVLFILLAIIYGFGGGSKYPGGSPGGYTGSPGDSKNCTYCHGGSATSALGWISSDIPAQGYIPGETYTITVTVSGTGDKGFEVSPQAPDGTLLGTLVDAAGVHLVNGSKAVTHDNSSSANPKVWEFQWTAPDAGTGEVTFYGAFTLNKPVTKLSVLVVQEDQSVSIEEMNSFNAEIYPVPVHDEINIALEAPRSGQMEFRLFSVSGSSFDLREPAGISKGMNNFRLPLPEGITPGIYFLNLRLGTSSGTYQILVR